MLARHLTSNLTGQSVVFRPPPVRDSTLHPAQAMVDGMQNTLRTMPSPFYYTSTTAASSASSSFSGAKHTSNAGSSGARAPYEYVQRNPATRSISATRRRRVVR